MAGSLRPSTAVFKTHKTGLIDSLRSISSQTSRNSDASAQNADCNLCSADSSSPAINKSRALHLEMPSSPPLAVLPVASVVRSLAISTISSSFLLRPSLYIMSILANSKTSILNPDRNALMRWALKKTFYVQFCAGENTKEVMHTIGGLKSLGYKGIILGYAKEVVMDKKEALALKPSEACIENEILPWKRGTLQTVELAGPEDFVALKFTGAGRDALYTLSKNSDPSPAMEEAITAICDLAVSRGVRLLFDAEQQAIQAGIDAWTLKYMKKYNTPEKAYIYGTYQAYLKATPSILAKHLALAKTENFTLGVKLVRGAYLATDPRHLIHDTKEDTDDAYDKITESLMRRLYGDFLKPANEKEKDFPRVDLVLATHNRASVVKAFNVRSAQVQNGEEKIDVVYGTLQGMADEVSCELLEGHEMHCEKTGALETPNVYKYLVWGSTGECMKYLLRRAEENRDAVQRTKEGRNAAASEIMRRVKGLFGFS